MSLKLYDTMTREKREFVPADPKRVTMYVCGPTVYNFAHIGNFRPVVVFDLLFRVLRDLYGEDAVAYAANVTDVDDKINKKAADEGVPISAISDRYLAAYNADAKALGALPPTFQPRVTQTMDAIIRMIGDLIHNNGAYAAEGHVLFDTQAFTDYGKLSGRPMDEMIAGARVDVAPYKRHPADFVLWKPSKPGEPAWESPWGPGRPGWHIECSAMIQEVLGLPIDIHGGGIDLVFPHHENELAQGVCSGHGREYARYWLHNGFLNMAEEKMSKSVGNVALAHDLLKAYPGEAIRWALLSGHYRQPLEWTDTLIEQAKRALDRLYQTLLDVEVVAQKLGRILPAPNDDYAEALLTQLKFREALHDDLNTPKALSELFALSNGIRGVLLLDEENRDWQSISTQRHALLKAANLMGFLVARPKQWFERSAGTDVASRIDALIAARQAARAEKRYQEADEIRDALKAAWIELLEGRDSASWRRADSALDVEKAAGRALAKLGRVQAQVPAGRNRIDYVVYRNGGQLIVEVKRSIRDLHAAWAQLLSVRSAHFFDNSAALAIALPDIEGTDRIESAFRSAFSSDEERPELIVFDGNGGVRLSTLEEQA